MITIKRTVSVGKDSTLVFDYLADFANAVEWDSGTVTCTRSSGDGGVGTTYTNTSKFMGRETDLTYVIEALEPHHRLVLRGENKAVVSRDTMMISTGADGTQVNYTAEFEFRGAAKLVQPLLKPLLEKLGNDTQKTLRNALYRL